MLVAGLWSRTRKRAPHRQRRERKAHFGELVQLDGSFHLWYEARAPRGCLMTLVDDATGRTLGRLGAEETIWAPRRQLQRLGRVMGHYAPHRERSGLMPFHWQFPTNEKETCLQVHGCRTIRLTMARRSARPTEPVPVRRWANAEKRPSRIRVTFQ
jgi:hypothetical protein